LTSRVAVLGGDVREVRVAELLRSNGHDVSIFGAASAHLNSLRNAESAEAAVAGSDWIVCPAPGLGPEDEVYAPGSLESIFLDRALLSLSSASKGGLILGQASPTVAAVATALAIPVLEMKRDRALAVVVGSAVAEAVTQILIGATSRLFREMRVLVLGYGATGSAIADTLSALGCDVVVASRNPVDRELARRRRCSAVDFDSWPECLPGTSIVINTVPDRAAIRADHFPQLSDAMVVDISSPPGGLDHAAAEKAGLTVVWARGLAGVRAPITVGNAQFEFVKSAIANGLRANGVKESGQ